ncbi:MAG: MATE family efflux transporter, partial [Luteimonas sp.]|nr:MATE family efflux transporter [Luteimonas sp.]
MSPPSAPVRFRDEVRTTAVLAAPLVAGHLSTGLIGFVDNVIAGRHGTNTLAGVAVGTAMFWLPMMIPMGTLMALPPSVSQLDGAGRRAEVGPLFRQALWLSVALGALLFAFLTLSAHALAPMGIALEVRPAAAAFLHGIRWGIPALTLYYCMRYLCDGLHWTM